MNIKLMSVFGALTLLSGGAFAAHNTFVDAANLSGQDVFDFHGKKLGDVKQVLLDTATGSARYAIIQIDKEWSLKNPEIAVPWSAMKITKKGEKQTEFALDTTKEKLDGAPRFNADNLDLLFDKATGAPFYQYWQATWPEVTTPANR
jgi:sporulation protein YlmC with PRC-barrel domain